MKEVLKALADRPMTAPGLARTIGIDPEVLGDIVTSLIAQDLVEEDGNKLVVTELGLKSLVLAESAHALPAAGSLMELGDDMEQEAPDAETLLQYMQEPMSATKISDASGIDVRIVRTLLNELKSRRLAQKYGNGYWTVIQKRASATVIKTVSVTELNVAEEVVEVDVPETFELAIAEPVPTDIEAALANLSQVLTPRQIQNLPTKLAVLERLSELLDPSIAVVLAEIQNDLQQAA